MKLGCQRKGHKGQYDNCAPSRGLLRDCENRWIVCSSNLDTKLFSVLVLCCVAVWCHCAAAVLLLTAEAVLSLFHLTDFDSALVKINEKQKEKVCDCSLYDLIFKSNMSIHLGFHIFNSNRNKILYVKLLDIVNLIFLFLCVGCVHCSIVQVPYSI